MKKKHLKNSANGFYLSYELKAWKMLQSYNVRNKILLNSSLGGD